MLWGVCVWVGVRMLRKLCLREDLRARTHSALAVSVALKPTLLGPYEFADAIACLLFAGLIYDTGAGRVWKLLAYLQNFITSTIHTCTLCETTFRAGCFSESGTPAAPCLK